MVNGSRGTAFGFNGTGNLAWKSNPLHDERNFEISDQGTYGTAGFMGTQEQKRILQADRGMEQIKGIFSEGSWSSGKYIKGLPWIQD